MTVYRRVTRTDKQNEKGQFHRGLRVEGSGKRVLLCWCDHRHWHRSHNHVYPSKPPPPQPVFKNTRGRAHVQTHTPYTHINSSLIHTSTHIYVYVLYINARTHTDEQTDGLRKRWPFNPFAGLAYKLLL